MLKIKMVGLDKLNKKLGEGVGKPLGEGLKKIVFTLEGETKKATVVDTGMLRSSIFSKYGVSGGMVGTNLHYAEAVEYGTPRMAARHMEGGTKVLGQGMFGFGFERLKKVMATLLKGIAVNIERKWGD